MKISASVTVLLVLSAISACGSQTQQTEAGDGSKTTIAVDSAHNSRNSLDWDGTYAGTLPCADCEGIRTTVTLRGDGTFTRELIYVGKSATAITESGGFVWNGAGSIVSLPNGAGGMQKYQVGENRLFHLDRDGNRISGDTASRYVLRKVTRDSSLEDRTWMLVELAGEAVVVPEGSKRPYLRFSSEESRLAGNASCNNFFGGYALAAGGRLRIGGNLGSTMMACPDMSIENRFMSALIEIDAYTVGGNTLSLLQGSAAPVMRFEAAED